MMKLIPLTQLHASLTDPRSLHELRRLCKAGKIAGAVKMDGWYVPEGVVVTFGKRGRARKPLPGTVSKRAADR